MAGRVRRCDHIIPTSSTSSPQLELVEVNSPIPGDGRISASSQRIDRGAWLNLKHYDSCSAATPTALRTFGYIRQLSCDAVGTRA